MGLFKRNIKRGREELLDEFTKKMIHDAQKCIDLYGHLFPNLEFSTRSLEAIDEMLDELGHGYVEFEKDWKDSILSSIGAYIFEMARRRYGGRYFWYEKGNQPILVSGLPDFEISLLVFDKVEKRILNGPEHNIPFFFQGFVERREIARPGDKVTIM